MGYFRYKIGVIAVLSVFLFYLLPSNIKGEEKTISQNNFESNIDNESVENEIVYNVKVISLEESIKLFVNNISVGNTPYSITLHQSEKVSLQGRDSRDRLVLDTVLEGGKTPELFVIQLPKKSNYLASAGMAILGGTAGYWIAATITLLMFIYR